MSNASASPSSSSSHLRAFEAAAAHRAHYAPTILRFALGAVFLAHAYAKAAIFTFPGTVSFFQAFGLPGWSAYPVFALELVGGVFLLLGLHVRLVSALLIPVMLGAFIPHLHNGWMFTNPGGGWEYVAVLLLALIAQLLLGPGKLAMSRCAPAEAQ